MPGTLFYSLTVKKRGYVGSVMCNALTTPD